MRSSLYVHRYCHCASAVRLVPSVGLSVTALQPHAETVGLKSKVAFKTASHNMPLMDMTCSTCAKQKSHLQLRQLQISNGRVSEAS